MPFNLTPFDQSMAEIVLLDSGGSAVPISGFPDGSSKIVFQFPPVITSDSKSIMWTEHMSEGAWEPFYISMGGKPRNATLKATYVVGGPGSASNSASSRAGSGSGGGSGTSTMVRSSSGNNPPNEGGSKWTARRVATEVRRWKSYFYNRGPTGVFMPVFVLNIYQQVPGGSQGQAIPSTWRGLNISFQYSDAMIADDADPKLSFPTVTEVTLTMELVTNIASDTGRIYDFKNLEDVPPQEWY